MTALELIAPSRSGLFARLRNSISRNEFFAGLFIVGCANALGAGILQSLNLGDWFAYGFRNISVVVWFACFAGVALLLRDKSDAVRRLDLAVAVLFIALVAVPVSAVNWVAVTGLSLYVLLFANGNSMRKRGAMILLALTVPMLWSRIIFTFFAKFFLEIDSWFVAWALGTDRAGNMVRFADGSGNLVIMPACSSLANVSLAFLCWVTAAQWTGHRRSAEDILWCGLACASVVAVNVTRMMLAGLNQEAFKIFHSPLGDTMANLLILGFTVGFTLLGVRRELFSRP